MWVRSYRISNLMLARQTAIESRKSGSASWADRLCNPTIAKISNTKQRSAADDVLQTAEVSVIFDLHLSGSCSSRSLTHFCSDDSVAFPFVILRPYFEAMLAFGFGNVNLYLFDKMYIEEIVLRRDVR